MVFFEPVNPRLQITFSAQVEHVAPGLDKDPSSLIPSSIFGNVISLINELMRASWDYALRNREDGRFDQIRRMAALDILNRRDIEFVIIEIKPGSIEILLDWTTVVFGIGAAKTIIEGMVPNAAWDLTKYSFQAIRDFIFRNREGA